MKKNTTKLFALLMAGFITISGCGASDGPEEATEENAAENAEETSRDAADADNNGNPEDGASAEEDSSGENSPESASLDNPASETENLPTAENPSSPESIPAPNTTPSTPSRPTQEELLAGERRSLVGIITDATKYSVSIQAPDGTSYYLTIPDTGVSGNLNYITIGQIATLTYAGSLEDTALLVGISDSGLVTGIYLEEYAFAIKIINAVKAMDMKALVDLTDFPVFLDTGDEKGPINTSKEFEEIDNEKIFSEALVNRIANYNLFDLKYTDVGFFVGGEGTPNITFDIDEEGIMGIIGINSAPASDNTKD